MKFLFEILRTTLSARLRRPGIWALMLLLPVLVAAAGAAFPPEQMSAPVQVGVCLPDAGAEAFWELLESRGGTVLTFHLGDEAAIDRNIALGRWDCGLILSEDFEEKMEDLDLDGLILVKTGPGSEVYPLVQETVAACIARLVSPGIAREYLHQAGILSKEEAASALTGELAEPPRVEVKLSTAHGEAMAPFDLAQSGIADALCWVVSGVILVWMLLCATDLSRWLRSEAAGRMRPLRRDTLLLLGRALADGLLACLSGVGAMILLGTGFAGVTAVAGYGLFWMGAAVLLARFPGISRALPVFVPFLAVISLLLSAVLVEVALPGVRFLPVNLFLAACRGNGASAGLLITYGAGSVACSLLADQLKKKV